METPHGGGPSKEPWTKSQASGTRAASASDRDSDAEDRDGIAAALDAAADERDNRADDRDRRAEAREQRDDRSGQSAASDREAARHDREAAASERRHAAADRAASATDRLLAARERAMSLIDDLTSAYRRDPGLMELQREIGRAKRKAEPLVLAFVDVDGLKAVNDSLGHAAGDQLLRSVVNTIRANTRTYDLIVRFGGDEFLCAMLDLTLDKSAARFTAINADLAEYGGASITAGLADLREHDTLEDLIDRADAALRAQRPARREPRQDL